MIPYISFERINDFPKLVSKNIENIQNELDDLDDIEVDERVVERVEDYYKQTKKKLCKRLIKLNSLGCYTLQSQPYINDENLFQRSYIMCLVNKKNTDYIIEYLESDYIDQNYNYILTSLDQQEKISNLDDNFQIVLNQYKNNNQPIENYIFNLSCLQNELGYISQEYSIKCSQNFYNDLMNNYIFLFITTKEGNEDNKKDVEKTEKVLLFIFKNIYRKFDWMPLWLLIAFIFYILGIGLYIFSMFR